MKRRSILRGAALTLALLAIAALVFLIPTLWGTPWSVRHYFFRTLVDFALDHPMLLSYGRVLDPYGLDFYSDELEDFSVEARLAQDAKLDGYLAGLRAYDRARQSPEDRVSMDALEWLLTTRIAGRPFLFHGYPVNQFDGLQSFLPDFMVNIHQVEDEDDARSYLARLEAFPLALGQIGDDVRQRALAGVLPPRFVIESVREEMRAFVAAAPDQNLLYTHLRDALETADGISDSTRDSLLARARQAIEESVQPAYRRLADTMGELEGAATDEDGVWKLPDGDAYYRWALRWHTTTDLSPDEVHAIGLDEIRRIHGEMRAILASVEDGPEGGTTGAAGPTDVMQALQALNRDPAFLYSDDADGRQQILDDYQALVDETWERLPALFGRLPVAPVLVRRVPPFKEEGSAGAYYNPPSLDGTRPGVFYANLRDVAETQRFRMRTLTYHEAIPGHHMQIAIAMENRDLPLFRRFMPLNAFTEGWALYAERVALEEGFHRTPYDRLGALAAENFRAVRLVVDTGIHAKRWPRERAIEYMIENAGMVRGDAVAEVERYIVAPGQACGYKIGQLRILELRERARKRLGDRFDLREFHDRVLASGSLPLPVLERMLDDWAAAR